MTNSEIAEIIIWKQKELNKIPKELEWWQVNLEIERDILKWVIHRLNFELRQRDPDTKTENTKELLDQKKREISITNLIQTITWKDLTKLRSNIQCPLPTHKDKTGSFHIYENSNSFKCFWCQQWWSWIDFIKEYYNISLNQAIKRFLQFN
jgi:hypothetical protein